MTCFLKTGDLWNARYCVQDWKARYFTSANWKSSSDKSSSTLPLRRGRDQHWVQPRRRKAARTPGCILTVWTWRCCVFPQTCALTFIGLPCESSFDGFQLPVQFKVNTLTGQLFFPLPSVVCGRTWGNNKMQASLVSTGSQNPSGKINNLSIIMGTVGRCIQSFSLHLAKMSVSLL